MGNGDLYRATYNDTGTLFIVRVGLYNTDLIPVGSWNWYHINEYFSPDRDLSDCVKPEGKHYFRTFCRADDPGSCIKRSITARSYSDTDNI